MKTVTMICPNDFIPCKQGSDRAVYEFTNYLGRRKDILLNLAIVGVNGAKDRNVYSTICNRVSWIMPPKKWGIWDILNKIFCRLGLDVFRRYFVSIPMRRQVLDAIKGADVVLLNYTSWFNLLPRNIRQSRCCVITVDLLYYRRRSFYGDRSFLSRTLIYVNKLCELCVLKTFNKIGVYAHYEKQLLVDEGISSGDILELGMPVSMPQINRHKQGLKYDFSFIGGNSFQNEACLRCFCDRVASLFRNDRQFTVVIIGSICKSKVIETLNWPGNFTIIKVGYSENPYSILAQCSIGIGTVPFGSGVKVKVVESIMAGLPMVVTNSGIEGIPVDNTGIVNIDSSNRDEVKSRIFGWLDGKDKLLSDGFAQAAHIRSVFSPANCLSPLISYITSKTF